MKQKIILIGNPVAGGNAIKKIEKAVGVISNRGFDVRLMLTTRKGDAESFAREVLRDKSLTSNPQSLPLIIAAGGDGTYNEVINGIACTDIPMAILSLGTTNVLTKELNIPEDIENAVEVALKGNAHLISLGKITAMLPGELEAEREYSRYFCLMAGIGYDGEVVYGVNNRVKKYSGKGSYILNGIKTLLKWNPEKLIFNIDGRLCEGYSAIICNASKYAGNFKVAPDAVLNEPFFYAFVMHGRGRLDMLRYISGIFRGKHLLSKDITCLKAERVEIKGNARIQIDGDYLGPAPAKIEAAPKALRLVY